MQVQVPAMLQPLGKWVTGAPLDQGLWNWGLRGWGTGQGGSHLRGPQHPRGYQCTLGTPRAGQSRPPRVTWTSEGPVVGRHLRLRLGPAGQVLGRSHCSRGDPCPSHRPGSLGLPQGLQAGEVLRSHPVWVPAGRSPTTPGCRSQGSRHQGCRHLPQPLAEQRRSLGPAYGRRCASPAAAPSGCSSRDPLRLARGWPKAGLGGPSHQCCWVETQMGWTPPCPR